MVDNFYEFEKFINSPDEESVNVLDPWELYEQIENKDKDKCINCQRLLPNEDFRLKDKCIWCDIKYHKSTKIIALKKLQEIKNG